MEPSQAVADPADGSLIRAKLRPRPTGAPALLRATVLSHIAEEPVPVVTLLNAAAGYGKTTTLRQWWLALRERGVSAAWLTLDRHDEDPATFVSYLVAAFAEAGVAMGDLLTAARAKLVDTPVRAVLPRIIERVAGGPGPVYLFLDDYHLAASPAVDVLLDEIIGYAGSIVRFVIATRRRPGLQLSDLHAKHAVREFGAAELRFDRQECLAYFGYQDAVVDALVDSSEGWPTAIHLSRLWLERRPAAVPGGQPPRFTGRSAGLASYLTEQVLADLPAALRERLLCISILERFNGELVDAVCGGVDGWRFVEDIAARGLFVSALDDEQQWFALHQLFREFLYERLRRDRGGDVVELHRRAVAWYASHGNVVEAVQVAQRSGDAALLAATLARAGGWCLALRAGSHALRPLMAIGRDTAIARPVIAQAQVYVLLQAGELDAARRLFDDAVRAAAEGGDATPRERLSLRFMDNLLLLYEDRLLDPACIEALRQEFLDPGLQDLPERELVATFQSYAHYQHGDFEACIAAGRAALGRLLDRGAYYGAFFLHGYIGLAELALGRLESALQQFAAARTLATLHYSVHSNLVAMANVLLAEVACRRGDLPAARALLQPSLEGIRGGGWYEVVVVELAVKAALLVAEGRLDAALGLLDEGQAHAAAKHWPRLADALCVQRLDLLLCAGRMAEATALANEPAFTAFVAAAGADPRRERLRQAARAALVRLGSRDPAAGGRVLSGREAAVLRLLGDGLSTKEMARRLALSEGTVKVHRKRLYRKLGVHCRSAALAVARNQQLLA